ncbi:MAG: cell division protein FtsQ/DivIB [Ignavibacteriales bacterium]
MRGKKQIFLIFIFLCCVSGVLLFAILRLDFFKIDQIEVVGIKKVSEKEILKRSGLIIGGNMVFFSDAAVTREILKNSWITDVHIKREFPGKVIVEIKEAEPFCMVLGEEGELYYMSKSGKKLGKANFDIGLDFPVLTGEGIEDPELLGEVLEILKFSLKSAVLTWKEISEINVNPIYGITVLSTDGRRVDFGQEDIEKKWYRVEKIISHARGINLTEKYINISSGKIGIVDFKL